MDEEFRHMAFCRCCGKEIHETAPTCPICGGKQYLDSHSSTRNEQKDQPIWQSVTSLIIGILCVLTLFDDSSWDDEALLNVAIVAGVGFSLGVVSITYQYAGKGMAVSGVVLNSITALCLIGLVFG